MNSGALAADNSAKMNNGRSIRVFVEFSLAATNANRFLSKYLSQHGASHKQHSDIKIMSNENESAKFMANFEI